MAKRKPQHLLDLPCEFGGVSIGDKTARVGITVGRGDLDVEVADRHLVERRLTGTLLALPDGSQPDQGTLPGVSDGRVQIDGTFDVKGVRLGGRTFTFGATFNLKGLDVEALSHFAKRAGKLLVVGSEEIPEDEELADLSGGNGTLDDEE